jgi:glucose-1-phosphate cytidylyltransferase
MKVVLFCGGLGTRLREHSDTIPKPLVSVGIRPILWHLMRYYAHYGHKDFVLALGYRGDLIREYFLNYDESLSNDFTLSGSGESRRVELHSSDMHDWRITFVDTGLHANLGERLLRVRKFVENEPMFLANYSDGLSDLPLDKLVGELESQRAAVATFAAVRSWHSFHTVEANKDGVVTHIGPLRDDSLLINGGFFAFRSSIFDYLGPGEELVEQPFQRLIKERKLLTHRYAGFWQAMDTFKDKITFDRMAAKGECPWMVWRANEGR